MGRIIVACYMLVAMLDASGDKDPFCGKVCTGDTDCNQETGCMQCSCPDGHHQAPCVGKVTTGKCQAVNSTSCGGDPDGPQNTYRTPTNRSLPQYLMIGDSITGGMWPHINTSFWGNVDVVHSPRNAGDSGVGQACVIDWLGKDLKRWDVITYNFGCWDTSWGSDADGKHPNPRVALDRYKLNLQKITKHLQRTKAKLLYVSTTPSPNNKDCCPNGGKLAPGMLGVTDCPVVVNQYNAVAKEVVTSLGVEWFDLHAVVEKQCGGEGYKSCEIQPQTPGVCNVHFSDWGKTPDGKKKFIGGWKLLADAMVGAVRKVLKGKRADGAELAELIV